MFADETNFTKRRLIFLLFTKRLSQCSTSSKQTLWNGDSVVCDVTATIWSSPSSLSAKYSQVPYLTIFRSDYSSLVRTNGKQLCSWLKQLSIIPSEWTFRSKINTQDSGFLCTSLKKVLCYIYTRYAPALFILLWLIRWRAFFVSFRHFSKCCTLLCLSCRPGKEKGREKHLKVEKWGQFTKRSNTILQQSHNYHTQNILNKKKNSQSVYKSTVHFKKFCCAGLNKQITK